MFINKDSIIINGVSFGQYLVDAKFGYHKFWSKDSGRNLAGSKSGTLIGIFPKLTLQFRKLNRSELEIVAPILDSEEQTLSYYDPTKQSQTTLSTYSGDWEVVSKKIISDTGKNEGFTCAFISNKKRV